MKMVAGQRLSLVTTDLRLDASLTPWDADIFGYQVAHIESIECLNRQVPIQSTGPLFDWLDRMDVRLVSCRLPADRLYESMLLESCGFRFVEVAMHPTVELPHPGEPSQEKFAIELATETEVPFLESIAARAFSHGRIHVDPRLGPEIGNRRYAAWVRNCTSGGKQRLMGVRDRDGNIVAVFIVESLVGEVMYWHLTAMAPEYQGRGIGWQVWSALLERHAADGVRCVRTTISATNVPVLNLYAKLGFRFLSPSMTFHWIRGAL